MQGFVWGWEAGNKGLVSTADRDVYESPVSRPLSPSLWDKLYQTAGHRDYMYVRTHLFLGAVLFSRLKWAGETVNGGAESAVHLDRDWLGWLCYFLGE